VGIELLTLRVRPIVCVRVGRQDVSITHTSISLLLSVYSKICRNTYMNKQRMNMKTQSISQGPAERCLHKNTIPCIVW
jgi:hypothetical protein